MLKPVSSLPKAESIPPAPRSPGPSSNNFRKSDSVTSTPGMEQVMPPVFPCLPCASLCYLHADLCARWISLVFSNEGDSYVSSSYAVRHMHGAVLSIVRSIAMQSWKQLFPSSSCSCCLQSHRTALCQSPHEVRGSLATGKAPRTCVVKLPYSARMSKSVSCTHSIDRRHVSSITAWGST